jgi:hypothetical protein
LGAGGEGLAYGGERHTAPGAVVNRVADDTFHLRQQARGGGLGGADLARSKADLPSVGQGGQQAQMAQFQAALGQKIGAEGLWHINLAICLYDFII